jgi:L-amino acid N-acyltransferase YncA
LAGSLDVRRACRRGYHPGTQTANNRSMHLAAKLGFIEVARFEE